MPSPIEHEPDPSKGEWAGHSGSTQIRRIVATVEWDDGSTTQVPTFAYAWTRTHVHISVPNPNPNRGWGVPKNLYLWVRSDQVRENTTPPVPGESIPAPNGGPTAVQPAWPDTCPDGHRLVFGQTVYRWTQCGCAAGERGHHVWTCHICGERVYGPPHDPDHRQHDPY